MSYELVIRSYSDDNYRHVVAVRETEGALVRIEDGVNINLNHETYYTAVEKTD